MDNWGTWIAWSMPLFFAVTNNLEAKAKGRALWAYFWLMAAFSMFNTWHLYTTWHALATPEYPPLPEAAVQYTRTLWASAVETVVLLVLPVVWYCRDRHKEQIVAGASQTV